jgi:hypothetical protein
MATKVSQIASWVIVCSLTWAQRKRWIPIRSMGCLQLKDGVVQVTYKVLCKNLRKIIERLGKPLKKRNPKSKIKWSLS